MAHSWEVVCVETDPESPHDDCRQITDIGFNAPTLTTKPVDQVSSMIESGLSAWHIQTDDGQLPLRPIHTDQMYVRTMDEDSPQDPLLEFIECTKFEQDERLERALG